MESGDGMVAVIREIREAGLAVTLLDGPRQYTLLPNPVSEHQTPTLMHISHVEGQAKRCTGSNTGGDRQMTVHCDSSAQATDGHYASMYKMAHCNVTPTAPPVQLTEFPPQRAELCRGHGNFEVGGFGSGENYSPIKSTGVYKGGMSWPDRGSVCAPRPSTGSDAFANSLRRYPTLSPDRSEVVERLINYTHTKNSKTHQTRTQTSPPRLPEIPSNQSTNGTPRTSSRGHRCEHEVNGRTRSKVDDSPTRDFKPKKDCECPDRKSIFTKTYDVRYLSEVSRKFKDTLRISSYPYSHPVCPIIKERYEHLPPVTKLLPDHATTNFASTETQETGAYMLHAAAVETATKESSTVPRVEVPKRTVAVPLSPTSSIAIHNTTGEPETKFTIVHTSPSPIDLNKNFNGLKSVQTCSSIDLVNTKKVENNRRSKSEEELSTRGFETEIVKLLEEVEICSDLNARNKILRDEIEKRFSKNASSLINNSMFGGHIKNSPNSTSEYVHCRASRNHFENERNDEICFDIDYRKSDLDSVIKDWVAALPIKDNNFLSKGIDKESVKNTIVDKLKYFISNFESHILTSKIFDYLFEVPFGINRESKSLWLNKQIQTLLNKIPICYKKSMKNDRKITGFKKCVPLTRNDLRQFIRNELYTFLEKSKINLNNKHLEELEIKLLDIVVISLDRLENNEELKNDLLNILVEISSFSYKQAVTFIDTLLKHSKHIFEQNNITKPENTFIVMQSSFPNSLKQTNLKESSDFSISAINSDDLDANLDFYMNQLTHQIDEWLKKLGIHEEDKNLRQVVVNDLASDIVDRHKYLELNPANQGIDEEELEHLKYQIFKWINKLVGEENTNTIDHADDLMKRIKNIPVPKLTKLGQSMNNSLSESCRAKQSKSPARKGVNFSQVEQSSQGIPGYGNNQRSVCPGSKNIRQVPMFGPSSLGGSMIESYSRVGHTDRRHSSPGRYNNGHMRFDNNMNNSKMPMFGPPGLGGSMTESYPRPANTVRRYSGPTGYRAGPMDPGFSNSDVNQIPMFGSTGSGGSMIGAPPKYTSERKFSSSGNFVDCPGLMRPDYASGTCGTGIRVPESSISGSGFNINLSQIPVFGPTGPGGSVTEGYRNQTQISNPRSYGPRQTPTADHGITKAFVGSGKNTGPHLQSSNKPSCCQGGGNLNQTLNEQRTGPSNTPRPHKTSNCCPSKHQLLKPTMMDMDKEFDDYLEKWVQKIPIPDKCPEDLGSLQETLISNIYKAIAIVKCNPEVLNNSVLYQDLLEEQLDVLFEQLPKSPELTAKQQGLKIELLQKVTNIEKDISKALLASSYRAQLLDNIINNMPGAGKVYDKYDYYVESKDINKRGEIADNFILQMYFKDDKVKNNVYRMKVVKGIRDIVDEICRNQKISVNLDATVNSLLGALHHVPVPPEEELKIEADHILLAQEVEQWLTDLPILESEDIVAASEIRKLRDEIVKKTYEIEHQNIENCAVERELREEVLKVIKKVPMSAKEDVNINFMVDELINRLKSRPKEVPRRKSVSFNNISAINYEDFGRSGMLCSSYINNDSYYMVDGVRVELPYIPIGQPKILRGPILQEPGQTVQISRGVSDIPSEEFFTMEETVAPNIKRQIYPQPMMNQTNDYAQPAQPSRPSSPERVPQMFSGQQGMGQIVQPSYIKDVPPSKFHNINDSALPMQQTYTQEMTSQNIANMQSMYGSFTSQGQQMSAYPHPVHTSPRDVQHLSCAQPMPLYGQGADESLHATGNQERFGNVVSTQPFPGQRESLGRTPQIPCGQSFPRNQQVQPVNQQGQFSQSVYVPVTQEIPCGQPSIRRQTLPAQTNHGSMASGRPLSNHERSLQIPYGQPVAPQEFTEAFPLGPGRAPQAPQNRIQQESLPSCCSSKAQTSFQQQPAQIISGNAVQIPAQPASSGLHTSQIAGPSRMAQGQIPQDPSQPSTAIPTPPSSFNRTSAQTGPMFGPDPQPPSTAGTQVTGTQVSSGFPRTPVANSTPQRELQAEAAPPRLGRKRTREVDRNRREHAVRRIDLEESDEEDDDECRCLEKLWRSRRRRPMFFSCDDDYGYHMRYPFPYFY